MIATTARSNRHKENRQNMQPEHLTSNVETSFLDITKSELNEGLGNTVKSAVSGLRVEAEKYTKELAFDFTKWMKDMDNATFELKYLLKGQPAIGPQADTFYQLIETQNLTFQTIIEKFPLQVAGGKVGDFNSVVIAQQENILLGLGTYLRKGVKRFAKVFKSLKWPSKCIVPILSILIHQIYNFDNPWKKVTKEIISTGIETLFGIIGSKIGALIGALGGPIGVVVGPIIGGMIGGIIGRYCSKRIYKVVCMIFFPKYRSGPGQPPIKGAKYISGQPYITGAGAIKKQPKAHGALPKGPPRITGAAAAIGLPKLW